MNELVPKAGAELTHQPYTGLSGRTRVERVRVFRTGREPVEVEVFRVLNVGEHPELRAPALSGDLHRLDDGELVEVPYVFHDPEALQFALVIPDGALGRELSARAKLLDSLMKEHEEDVPDYVRHFAIVYGSRGLTSHLADGQVMEVAIMELEPVDVPPVVASYYPRLAGLLPKAGFRAHANTDLVPLIDDGELWIFVQVGEDEYDAFSEASSDLLVQLKTVEQLPICILALTDSRTDSVRRAYLNPARSADGQILELLRRDFHATVVIYGEGRRLLRSFRVEAPRAANAKLILGRTELVPQGTPEQWDAAVEVCRQTPPSMARVVHPFVLEEHAPTASEALCRLQRLEAWSTPERIAEALTVLSVPRTVFELSRRKVVADALRFGLAMSNTLVLQAVRFGFAPDANELVLALRRQFEQTLPSASAQGLDEEQILRNRAALERLSRMHGTSTGQDVSCTM